MSLKVTEQNYNYPMLGGLTGTSRVQLPKESPVAVAQQGSEAVTGRAVDSLPKGERVPFVENLRAQGGYEQSVSTWSLIV